MDFKSERSFKWLYSQKLEKVKDLARIVQASYLWNEKNKYRKELLSLKSGNSWNLDIRDTARAVSALAHDGTVCHNTERWILSKQSDGAWNENVYDTAYVLSSLADMDSYNPEGCRWLIENYGAKWEHPGTTSLIISALIKQEKLTEKNIYADFVQERSRWLISKKDENGAWKTQATSNLVIQSLILAGYKDELSESVRWLLEKRNDNGSWGKEGGDINTTSLSLITFWKYLHY